MLGSNTLDKFTEIRLISFIIEHEKYTADRNHLHDYDFAMLKLDADVDDLTVISLEEEPVPPDSLLFTGELQYIV